MFEKYGLLIDNQWRPAASGKTLPVHSPATEEEIGTIPSADSEDVALVLASAGRGFATWRAIPAWDRAKIMKKAADLIRERNEEIARVMSAETGKPLAEARGEVNGAADQYEWYGEEAKRVYGQLIPARAADQRLSVVYQPVGVCLSLSAWNFPALLPSRKIAAALAAGCSVVARPASEAPGSCFTIVQALVDAGIPPGAVTVITGPSSKLAAELIASPVIRKVSLTGSVAVGKKVLAQCAEGVKRASMELGGHAPVIVCDDVDPVAAAKVSAVRKARNAGQVCTSPTRFFVQEAIYERFLDAFVAQARTVRVGDGMDPATEMGPLANHRRIDALEALVADARAKGARIHTGGERLGNRGYFFPLTVVSDLPDDARAMHEEPFGPLALINPVSSVEEAIGKANALPFGLAAYAFTHSARNADMLADGIEAGTLSINTLEASVAETPFGGVKDSGYGREGGAEGLAHYMVVKNVSHRMTI